MSYDTDNETEQQQQQRSGTACWDALRNVALRNFDKIWIYIQDNSVILLIIEMSCWTTRMSTFDHHVWRNKARKFDFYGNKIPYVFKSPPAQ